MDSGHQVKWTKAQRDRAKSDGRALFAVGFDGPRLGRGEMTGLMDDRRTTILFRFGMSLYRGMSPEEAFTEAICGTEPELLS